MQTNNLMSNLMHSQVIGYTPKVGDGLTICGWTDRHVGTIHVVHNDSHVEFTEDITKADKSKGELQYGHDEWVHTPTPSTDHNRHAMKGKDGRWYVARQTKTGKWSVSKKCQAVAMGHKNYYYDWSF